MFMIVKSFPAKYCFKSPTALADVMVKKMDSCMVDLCNFHSADKEAALDRSIRQRSSFEIRASKRRSFELGKRRPSGRGHHSLDISTAAKRQHSGALGPQLSGEVAA